MNRLYVPTPIGRFLLEAEDGVLVRALPCGQIDQPQNPCALLQEAAQQLQAYFAGTLQRFSIPLAPEGTAFSQAVWQALTRIPYGQTWTYGQLAEKIGHPGAARTVGSAAGRNPCLIFVPCHRLVAANGLGGFAYGLEMKKKLLKLECGRKNW